ncbi:MAG: hypothetical protein AUK44_01220 [Porphyromonadaceae bacterium CG2_30_38_12]|nr:MAG: hypothetical protein AUK44_01220 [Porphyromonadaceae bacterium CG2_30_38_12]
MNPKLSIITINRNNAAGLRRTIESVVSQTYTDFEYIIIDGASTDESVEVIKEFENLKIWEFENSETLTIGSRLQWVSEPDKGIYNAMNKGILKAKGEYLLMLNSGDWLVDSQTLDNVFKNNYNQDILYGNIIWTINSEIAFKTEFNYKLHFKNFVHASLAHQATFIKRKLHDTIGLYDENQKIVSDWSFFLLSLFKHNCTHFHLNLYIAISERDGISCLPQNQELIDEERRTFLKHNFNLQYEEYSENIDIENELIKYRNFYEKSYKTKIKRFLKRNKLLKKNNTEN